MSHFIITFVKNLLMVEWNILNESCRKLIGHMVSYDWLKGKRMHKSPCSQSSIEGGFPPFLFQRGSSFIFLQQRGDPLRRESVKRRVNPLHCTSIDGITPSLVVLPNFMCTCATKGSGKVVSTIHSLEVPQLVWKNGTSKLTVLVMNGKSREEQ